MRCYPKINHCSPTSDSYTLDPKDESPPNSTRLQLKTAFPN
jgi:hypothetical protein